MKLDATKMKDWQIAEAAEETMKPVSQLADEMGLQEDELIPMGRKLAKVDYRKAYARLKDTPMAKYIDVTAITPTPLGEGKTTTAIGLIEGLGKLDKRVVGAIRQPSGGPTPFSIRLTGDIDSITNAHNLAMIALTSRMQHERNYDDARL
ncbi:MAG: formate--tetrahydrofolate ligase, partial [Planctomycetota bacterium]